MTTENCSHDRRAVEHIPGRRTPDCVRRNLPLWRSVCIACGDRADIYVIHPCEPPDEGYAQDGADPSVWVKLTAKDFAARRRVR